MKRIFNISKAALLSLTLLFAQFLTVDATKAEPVKAAAVKAEPVKSADDQVRWLDDSDSDFCCDEDARLSLASLCAKRIKTKCIQVKDRLIADNACVEHLNTKSLCVKNANVTETLCTTNLGATNASIQNLFTQNLCARNATFAGTVEQCGLFRATVTYDTTVTYTLGDPLNFDVILDDPNGDVTLNPTVYTAPRSGYYIVTLQVNQFGLQLTNPADPILGAPVANPQIFVNGTVFRGTLLPFLTFSNAQSSTLTALISLQAGDEVSGHYRVFAVTDAGFVEIAGTVQVIGFGEEANSSMLKIHYLSSDCPPVPCNPDFTITCTPRPCNTCQPCCR